MAGKKKMIGGRKDNRGGKRSNPGGRPPNISLSRYQVDQMLKKAEQWAEERDGVTLDDILLKCAYGETDAKWKLTMRDRIACIKIFKEFTMIRVQEKNINYTEKQDAVLGLPPRRNDPAKIIPISGGVK